MSDKPLPNLMPALYAHRIHELQTVLYSCGYALALHGSMQRDLDVIAVPWASKCETPEELVASICDRMGLTIGPNSPTEKPHGRRVWTLMLMDIGFVDLSVMQPSPTLEL